MKNTFYIAVALILMSFVNWQNNFTNAKQEATEQHKFILLNFSGSDWCGPCIMFKKDVLESDVFKQFADSNLIMVNADFPRQKKNQLSKEQQKQNNDLADNYNKTGIFPKTLLLTSTGKIIKVWEGKPKKSTEDFIAEINEAIAVRK
ncbi:MAG: thioredoxin family protein [Chitinophagales bacterium]|nr:thioredoxin family protein [Chitinophagales bacterium]MBP6155214.1 thioredoxin family protein [Chitinophagales bacterium]